MGVKKEVIQFDLNGNEMCRYKSVNEVAEAFGKDNSFFGKKIKSGKEYKGFIFKYSGNDSKIDYNHPELDIKCPYCERHFKNYNGLCKHVIRQKQHGDVSREQLLTDYKYNGLRPTCLCGCGEYTGIVYDENGICFARYVTGHHNRIINNWGHNKKAQINSAETRRRQYQNGERIPWNKGKSWNETFDKEMQNKLMSIIQSKERRQKISNKLKGKEKSPEHKAFIKQMGQEEWFRELQREKICKRIKEGSFCLTSQMEIDFIEKCIKPLKISFERQYYINDLKHYCDVYIPEKNIIVEFNGDFWHCNPKKYKNGPIHKIQEDKVKKDEILRSYCELNDIMLIEIWESDFKKNPDDIKSFLMEVIN